MSSLVFRKTESGKAEIAQDAAFGPLRLRRVPA